MEAEGTLTLVAEVSVAFAGFTSVVIVLGGRGAGAWSTPRLTSLRLLIETSLIMLLTALLPLALHSSGLTASEAWAMASGIKAAQMLLYWGLSFRRFRRFADYNRSVFIAGTCVDLAFFGAQVLNAVGFFETPAAPYIAHLYYLVLAACASFIGVVAPLWQTGE